MQGDDLAVGQEDLGLEEDALPPRDPQAIATRENSSAVEASYRADGATNDTKKALAAFLARSDENSVGHELQRLRWKLFFLPQISIAPRQECR